jgi:hypothetical protein
MTAADRIGPADAGKFAWFPAGHLWSAHNALEFHTPGRAVRRRDRADAVYAQFAGRVGGHNSSLPKVRIEHTPELGLMVLHPINESALKGEIGRILLCGFDRVSLRG